MIVRYPLFRSWSSLSATAAIVAMVGCADSGSGATSLAALGVDDGASQGETTSALLTADSASTLELDKTGARLVVPEGAVTKDLKVELKRPADSEALPLVKTVEAQYKVASAPYVVTPHGSTFEKDLQLELPIAKGKSSKVVVARLDDEKDKTWEITGSPTVSGSSAKVEVRRFSIYVLLERVEDSKPSDVPATGSVEERLTAKLKSCNLLKTDGKLSLGLDTSTKEDKCEVDCVLGSNCVDFEAILCGSDATTDLEECYTSCVGVPSYGSVTCETEYDGPQTVNKCDGYEDCLDGADEAGCPASAFLSCESTYQDRIPVTDKCDGYEDCDDGSDEAGCPASLYFTCTNGERVSASSKCDAYEDCNDGSDEAGCSYFSCEDGYGEVPLDHVCDLDQDCDDGSDEDQGCLTLACVDSSIGDDSSLLQSSVKAKQSKANKAKKRRR